MKSIYKKARASVKSCGLDVKFCVNQPAPTPIVLVVIMIVIVLNTLNMLVFLNQIDLFFLRLPN